MHYSIRPGKAQGGCFSVLKKRKGGKLMEKFFAVIANGGLFLCVMFLVLDVELTTAHIIFAIAVSSLRAMLTMSKIERDRRHWVAVRKREIIKKRLYS